MWSISGACIGILLMLCNVPSVGGVMETIPVNSLREMIESHPDRGELPVELVLAICAVESSCQAGAYRPEPNYRWLVGNRELMSVAEMIGQKSSWGLMQTMGAVAREYHFDGSFTELWEPKIGLRYGMLHLNKLYRKHKNWPDTIASYNAGTPIKIDGKYQNQGYVDKVLKAWNMFEHHIPLKSTEV
jgi:soluble lytic murein transglycosylase-like protein